MAARNPETARVKAQAQVERLEADVERYTKHVTRDEESLAKSRRKLSDATAELEYARQHPSLQAAAPAGDVVEAEIADDEETVDDIPGQRILPPVTAG